MVIYRRVNCPFYFKIGACRHGDHCTRKHNRPTFSQTILVKNMYYNPKIGGGAGADPNLIVRGFKVTSFLAS